MKSDQTHENSNPQLRPHNGPPYNRILPAAQILHTAGGIINRNTILDGLQVQIPPLDAKYTGQTVAVFLWMNGYQEGSLIERHAGPPQGPGYTQQVIVQAGNTDVTFPVELTSGFAAGTNGNLLRSYVDYKIGNDWMIKTDGYPTNT